MQCWSPAMAYCILMNTKIGERMIFSILYCSFLHARYSLIWSIILKNTYFLLDIQNLRKFTILQVIDWFRLWLLIVPFTLHWSWNYKGSNYSSSEVENISSHWLVGKMATTSPTNIRRKYSWWWDSHICPKNSKWLKENLSGKLFFKYLQ